VTSGLAERLTGMGVPLHRLRIAMRVDNPLLTAWGIVWGPETAAEIFTISQALRESSTYVGSPSQYVMETGTWFRRRLDQLEPEDHTVLHEGTVTLTSVRKNLGWEQDGFRRRAPQR
jgi:adenylate cyclase